MNEFRKSTSISNKYKKAIIWYAYAHPYFLCLQISRLFPSTSSEYSAVLELKWLLSPRFLILFQDMDRFSWDFMQYRQITF